MSRRLRSRLCLNGLRISLAFLALIRLCLRELVREINYGDVNRSADQVSRVSNEHGRSGKISIYIYILSLLDLESYLAEWDMEDDLNQVQVVSPL